MRNDGRDEGSLRRSPDGEAIVRQILEECELVRREVQARVRSMDVKIAHVQRLSGRELN